MIIPDKYSELFPGQLMQKQYVFLTPNPGTTIGGKMFIDTDEIRKLRQKYYLQMQQSGIKTFQDMDRIEMERKWF